MCTQYIYIYIYIYIHHLGWMRNYSVYLVCYKYFTHKSEFHVLNLLMSHETYVYVRGEHIVHHKDKKIYNKKKKMIH